MGNEDKQTNSSEDDNKKVNTLGEGNENDDLEDDDNLEEGASKREEKVFTQLEVNRMVSKEKKKLKETLMKEFGLDTVDNKKVKEFAKFLSNSQSTEDKTNSEVKSLREELDKEKEKNLNLELKSSILEYGANKKYSQTISLMVKDKLKDDDESEIGDILKEIKKDYPEWFEEDSEGKMIGTGAQITGRKKKEGNTSSLGARLAEKAKSEGQLKSNMKGWQV